MGFTPDSGVVLGAPVKQGMRTYGGAAEPHLVPVLELNLPVATPGQVPHHVCSVWDTPNVETYPTEPPPQNVDKHCSLRWEPGGIYETTKRIYIIQGRKVITGHPGRMAAGHNHPGDAPYGWTPYSASPSYGGETSGVSNPAFDWFGTGGQPTWQLTCEPENAWTGSGGSGDYHWQVMDYNEAESHRNSWVWIWTEWTWGRNQSVPDPGATNTGSARVWIAGEDTPRIDKSNVNTHWWGQGMVTYWECTYWFSGTAQGMTEDSVVQVAGPRFGSTPQEAYEDNPVLHAAWQGESALGSWTTRPDVDGNIPVPAPLQW